MTALIDTGFMLAVLAHNDPYHAACLPIVQHEQNALIPSVILPELAYMVIRNMGREPFIQFMQSLLADETNIVKPHTTDYQRAMEIMEQYLDSKLDFVDCVVMAMAERLNISRILTVDQRDFRMFRPKHITAFTLLP